MMMSTRSSGLGHQKAYRRIHFIFTAVISFGLASVILWGLLAIYEPEAKLQKVNLRYINVNYSTIYIEMELRNRNYFRGYNYTDDGWVELFYRTNDSRTWELNYQYTPIQYQGFRDPMRWNFSMNITSYGLEWPKYSPPLKTQDNYIYMSLYLVYKYKILFWTAESLYYQWLDTNVYFNNNFDLKETSSFQQITNFTTAISS